MKDIIQFLNEYGFKLMSNQQNQNFSFESKPSPESNVFETFIQPDFKIHCFDAERFKTKIGINSLDSTYDFLFEKHFCLQLHSFTPSNDTNKSSDMRFYFIWDYGLIDTIVEELETNPFKLNFNKTQNDLIGLFEPAQAKSNLQTKINDVYYRCDEILGIYQEELNKCIHDFEQIVNKQFSFSKYLSTPPASSTVFSYKCK